MDLQKLQYYKFECPQCNQESDRDFNAAKNILLKNMSLIFKD
jgi:transposase